ncbi:FtsX-like permease family protein [Lacticaseibacillus baoqingensis]|uniref:FtsX-like permease family protein n=1 Tax=Lacticaseibacillus baoqingensis TaxID=2486013 RepID=A0ABW4E3M8_9LACO|nr:FtsX-like permease family protein [Lacticaseibacillus baoqingensis]
MGAWIKRSWAQHASVSRLMAVVLGSLLAVMYAVAALIDDRPLLRQVSQGVGNTTVFPAALVVLLVVMMLFSLTFLLYLNRLLLTRRDGELGLYRRLGMPASRLGRDLGGELGVIFAAGLGAGLLGGILVSKLLAMVLLRLVDVAQPVGLLVSPPAIGELSGYTVVVWLLLAALNAWYVKGHELLLYSTPDAAKTPTAPLSGLDLLGGLLGAVLLISVVWFAQAPTYWTSRAAQLFGNVWGLLGSLVFGLLAAIGGVYLLFACTLPVGLAKLAKLRWARPASRYLPLMIIVRRLRANRHSLWLTTALTTVTLTVIGGAAVLYQFGQTVVAQNIAQPIVATASGQRLVAQTLAKTPGVTTTPLATKLVAGKVRLRLRSAHDRLEKNLYQVIAQSDYQRIRRQQSQLPAIAVRQDQAVLLTTAEHLYQVGGLGGFDNTGRSLRLPQIGKRLVIKAITADFPLGSSGYFDRGLVVSDQQYAQITAPVVMIYGTHVRGKLAPALEKPLANSTAMDFVALDQATLAGSKVPTVVAKAPGQDYLGRDAISLRRPALHQMNGVFGFVLFVILMLGAVFMVATASILLLKQLAEARNERAAQVTLRRLGMPQPVLTRVIYTQIMVIFALPLGVGAGGAALLIKGLKDALGGHPSQVAGAVFGVYTLVYLVFAWVTAARIDRQARR